MQFQPITGDHQLYCEAAEPSALPALLLIHGFLSSRAQWQDNLAGLSTFVRPVVVELPGHGRSPSPSDPAQYELPWILDQLDMIRTAIGAPDWFVCGHSLGGAMALNFALRFPQATRAIVFTNSRSALEANDGSLRQDAGPVLEKLRTGGTAALQALPFHPRHMRNVSDSLKAQITKDAELLDPDGIANLMTGALSNVSVRTQIEKVEAPSLLVNGFREKSFQDVRHWLASTRPDFEIVDLDAGHSPNAELPEAFNDTLRAFLAPL